MTTAAIEKADAILATFTESVAVPKRDTRPIGERFPLGCIVNRIDRSGAAGFLRLRVVGYSHVFGFLTLIVRHYRTESPLYWIGGQTFYSEEVMVHDAVKVEA